MNTTRKVFFLQKKTKNQTARRSVDGRNEKFKLVNDNNDKKLVKNTHTQHARGLRPDCRHWTSADERVSRETADAVPVRENEEETGRPGWPRRRGWSARGDSRPGSCHKRPCRAQRHNVQNVGCSARRMFGSKVIQIRRKKIYKKNLKKNVVNKHKFRCFFFFFTNRGVRRRLTRGSTNKKKKKKKCLAGLFPVAWKRNSVLWR